MTNATASKARNAKLHGSRPSRRHTDRRRRIPSGLILWAVGLTVVAAVIGVAMANSAPSEGGLSKPAAPFTLTNTAGKAVSLADYRGKPSCCTSTRAPDAAPAWCRWRRSRSRQPRSRPQTSRSCRS